MAGIPILTHLGLDHFIGADAGEVRLDGDPLPGLLQSLSIRGSLRTDAAAMVSGATRAQPLGFDAPTLRLVLALTSEPDSFASIGDQIANLGGDNAGGDAENTCYGKAEALEELHQTVDGDGNPVPYRLTNVHANARGIKEAWFTGLETAEANDDVILATLEFTQVESHSFKQLAVESGAAAGAAQPGLGDEDAP